MKRLFIMLLVFLLFFGCTQKEAKPPAPPPITYLTFTDGTIVFQYPKWPDMPPQQGMFLAKNNLSCFFTAASYPLPPSFFEQLLKANSQSFSSDGKYADYTIGIGEQAFKGRSRLIYCDYKTYAISIACVNTKPDAGMLSSATCKKRQLNTKPKLGLIANPPNNDITKFTETIRDARTNGVDVLYWYFSWADLADNWTVSDILMPMLSHEGRTAIVMEAIHTNTLGRYPSKYTSFDQPGFKEDYAAFSVAFVKRYHPDYYFLGNEVDDYFYTHREQLPAFKELLRYTREKIKQESPTTKVGFTATYHDAIKNNDTDIIQNLAEDADIIGYTDYGAHDLFVFDNVSRGIEYLDGPKTIVPGKPYAIVEAGWSTSAVLNSSEDKQADYARGFFAYLNNTDAEFVNWFNLHDDTDCSAVAGTFLTESPQLKGDAEFLGIFKEFLCNFGLKKADGTPKKAWQVWQENTA
ncbi:MAG: hypothetical protein V1492_03245 [Candidatus Micrarchaeota archaeon]